MTRRAEARREERRWRRGDVLAVAAALLLGAALAWTVLSVQHLATELRTANSARDALASQVQQLGEKPVAGPPGSRGNPGGVGRPGKPGSSGSPGPSGKPGSAGSDGAAGKAGRNGTNGQPGPAGSPAASGRDGAPGQRGDPGEPGPAVTGPPGQQGEQGPAGEPGKDGKDGADGADGRDGQTCPDGYSLQPPPDDPDALVCRRDGAPSQQDEGAGVRPQSAAVIDRKRW